MSIGKSVEVLIIGAGISGLSAARELSAAGMGVLLLEGRDRIGGRVFTHRTAKYPVELGAEFIHGRPAEIFALVQEEKLKLAELEWNVARRKGKRWHEAGEVMSGVDELFGRMSADRPDQSFREFLDRQDAAPEVREQALGFVEGFHAADAARVSVRWLANSNAADEEIDGDRQYRFAEGYETLVKSISSRIDWAHCDLRPNTTVTAVEWKQGETLVRAASGVEYRAARAIITVPVGVLKMGSIRFSPRLVEKEKALQGLEMGPVIRASLCFRDKFWESRQRFQDVSFLFTDDPHFPTWWTSNPLPFPILTGWAAGHYAQELRELSSEQVIQCAVQSLARIFEMEPARMNQALETGFTYDWQSDPFSCGAYSYANVGASDAGRELGAPVANTLFFAGEATDADGHSGTVHGAIASGLRAAKEVLTPADKR